MNNSIKRAQGIPNFGQEQNEVKMGKSWFFGIGIHTYKEFQCLNNAVNDIKAIRLLLTEKYDVDPDCAITIFDEDAKRENIIDQLDALVKEVKQDDKLIIFLS